MTAARPLAGWQFLRRRRVLGGIALFLVVVLVVLWLLSRCSTEPETVRVAAVGDMVCDPDDPDFRNDTKAKGDHCRHRDVSNLAVAMHPDILLGLGDYQYELPTTAAYQGIYQPSYGRLLDRTVPVFGNQEYKVQDANTFTAYFGDRIRDPRGYWSQEIGRWHLVVLNSNCSAVAGGCGTGSPQQTWLAQDLSDNGRRCVIAAWHHPRWSNGLAGPDSRTADLFRTLYDHQVELVLSGHEADYERFGPLNPDGKADPQGVRQYVAGTGGQAHYRPVAAAPGVAAPGVAVPGVAVPGAADPGAAAPAGRPASEFADYDHHGVLQLDLAPDSWSWRFHALEANPPVEDQGQASCH